MSLVCPFFPLHIRRIALRFWGLSGDLICSLMDIGGAECYTCFPSRNCYADNGGRLHGLMLHVTTGVRLSKYSFCKVICMGYCAILGTKSWHIEWLSTSICIYPKCSTNYLKLISVWMSPPFKSVFPRSTVHLIRWGSLRLSNFAGYKGKF
jgi:hypothetical protein